MAMTILSEAQVQANKERYQALVGKTVSLIVTGLTVTGTVKEFKDEQFSFVLVIEHEPVNWGGDIYTVSHSFARKCDDWGSLNNVVELD